MVQLQIEIRISVHYHVIFYQDLMAYGRPSRLISDSSEKLMTKFLSDKIRISDSMQPTKFSDILCEWRYFIGLYNDLIFIEI